MASIFLSHSHVDKQFARKLAADLRSHGHVVWIDEAEINIGDSLVQKIREGIDQVDFVAAILSTTSVASEWVRRELDIASNREMEKGKVVVLPLLIEEVELPGFLKGKFYGNFKELKNYRSELKRLLRSLGTVEGAPKASSDELVRLQAELDSARASAQRHVAEAERARKALFRNKSAALQAAVLDANKRFPLHAPINSAYAFELSVMPITLDYILWCISKSKMRGVPHQIEFLIELEGKWDEVNAMLDAYKDMLNSMEASSESEDRLVRSRRRSPRAK